MSVLAKSVGFSLLLTLLFTLVTYLLPQVEGEAPQEQQVDLDSLTMEQFVAWGEELFDGKGTCILCHQPPPMGRAPDIVGVSAIELANERLADPRYRGNAGNAVEYLRESLVDPGAYVPVGWGKKGSNDLESPMPAVDRAPIELTAVEIDAIIAWLQAKDGRPVTVALPSEAAPATSGAPAAPVTTAGSAEAAMAKHACVACHAWAGSTATLGPPLDNLGERMAPEAIRTAIIDPDRDIAKGYSAGLMPRDFAERMTVKELQLIVDLLAGPGL